MHALSIFTSQHCRLTQLVVTCWVSFIVSQEWSMARSTPVAQHTALTYQTSEGVSQTIVIGSADWYDWLGDASHRHFAFQGCAGRFTARKERKQRGGWYWTAYRQVAGKLHKAYLGKSEELSVERLEAVAAGLPGRQVPPRPTPRRGMPAP